MFLLSQSVLTGIRSRLIAAIPVLLLLLPSLAGAASIHGRASGAGPSLDGPVTISAMHLGTGVTKSAVAVDDGSFSIQDFPAGEAVLVLSETGGDVLSVRHVTISEPGLKDVVLAAEPHALAPTFNFVLYKGEYFQEATTLETADEVSVTAPNETSNINFTLSPGGGTISGRVTNEAGTVGIPGLLVFGIGMESFVFSFDRTDATGHYQITGIPADSFLVATNFLFFSQDSDYVGEFYENTTNLFDADAVNVTEGNDTANINFFLTLGGSISGRVTAASGGAGVPFAEVFATSSAILGGKGVTADVNGNYLIRGLTPGNYVVSAEGEGLLPEYWNNKPDAATADSVLIVSNVNIPNINFSLAQGATINGTVRMDGTNAPLENVFVIASNGDLSWSDVTNVDGTYSINGLPAGTYTVAVPEMDEWFNNRPTEEEADPVVVPAGGTVNNINFSGVLAPDCFLEPGTAGAFSGRVTGVGGAGVPEAVVTAYLDFSGFRFEVGEVETDASGNYVFDCLTPGDYVAHAAAPGTNLIAEFYLNADSASATSFNVVEDATVDDIDFTLSPGGSISGRVTIQGTSTGIASALVTARHLPSGALFETITNSSGNYTLGEGEEGGMASGNYIVWASDHSTANLALVPVVLSRFEAFEVEDGIAIEWDVTGDTDVTGFHIYRSDDVEPAPVRLTEFPISGSTGGRFVDREFLDGRGLLYWLGVVDRQGREERFGPLAARGGVTPLRTQLFGPGQNPVRESSDIRFSLASPGRVSLRIHDISGRLVRTLVDDERPAGIGSVRWDARRDDGRKAAGGVYYVRFESGPVTESTKLVLAR
jgi:hypothetical protein